MTDVSATQARALSAGDLALGSLVLDDPQVTAAEAPRPYLHPLTDARGRVLTDHRPADHLWHHGLSIAPPVVRHGDRLTTFWGGPTYVRDEGYVDLDNAGRQRVDAVRSGLETTELDLTWLDERGIPLLAETRVLAPRQLDDDTWELDLTSTWRSLADVDLRFGSPTTEGRPGAGYGGLFLRAHPRFTGAEVLLAGYAEARSDEEVMGENAEWCALSAPGEGTVVMTSESGPVEHGPWFVRSEPVPMLCAASFFYDEWVLPPGAEATWRWRLISSATTLDGDAVDRLVRRSA